MIKFLTDAMLGKLTVLLRIFGYNTVYANDLYELDVSHLENFPIHLPNPIPDDILFQYANLTERIILTKDLPFYRRSKDQSFFLEGKGVYNYLRQLKEKFELKYEFEMEKALCSNCNSPIKKVSNKESIKNKLKNSTYAHYDTFFQCTNPECQKIFWNGPHIKDIKEKLNKYID
ncbi:MAG: hypothetical protein EU541_00355 [Promethearchaeota archaeon]|nr:MAG: hypothetical protein EU541_00355 [Candidatus Lokiarchaeota archaeon]